MKRIALTFAAVATLMVASLATAAISVYKTSFSTRSEYASVERLSGGPAACKRSWRGKKSVGVVVKGGEADCALSTPVEGDSRQPDHTVKATAVVTKGTDKKVRDSVYVGVAVRASSRGGYELRIFPKARRYQLLRDGQVLDEDRVGEIEALDEKNRLQIAALGKTVTAKVNGKMLTEFRDKNAEQVDGRLTAITYGDRKRSKRAEGVAFFDKLKVQVPTP